MNPTRPTEVRAALHELGVRPSKALGQNFLIDRNILDILLGAAELSADDVVLEIGPGLGVVTGELLSAARRVVAVEKDGRLSEFLSRAFAGSRKLELIHADALTLDFNRVFAGVNKVVANLPYSVGSRLLVECFRADTPPALIVVTVQEEVAQRLAAPPDDPARGLLSVWAQLAHAVRLVKRVSSTCFWPAPEVGSAIVSLRRHARPLATPDVKALFFDLTRRAFTYRRKQLATVLHRAPPPLRVGADATSPLLHSVQIDPAARPERLSVEDWLRLAGALLARRQ